MKTICMVTTSEIFHDSRILNEATSLSMDFKVKILAKDYGQKEKKFPFELKLIKYKKTNFFMSNIFLSILALAKACFQENPDFFHAHDLDGLLAGFPAAAIKRKALIYDSHELWSQNYPFSNQKGIQWLLGPLEKLLMLKVKAGITVNDSIATYLKKRYNKNFLALRNLSAKSRSKTAKSIKKQFPGKKIILHLGAADEGRGLEQIIGAAEYLPKNFEIVFLGGGKTEKEAKKLVSKLKLNNVQFLPPVSPEEIAASIKGADLGLALTQKISLSYYYSLPNKIFQYIGARIPILGSNFPEFRKIILANGVGEVVDSANPEKISQKIIDMVKKTDRYQSAYKKILSRDFTWEKESLRLVNFYKTLFNNVERYIANAL